MQRLKLTVRLMAFSLIQVIASRIIFVLRWVRENLRMMWMFVGRARCCVRSWRGVDRMLGVLLLMVRIRHVLGSCSDGER